MTLNANRGITLGDPTGTNTGTIEVDAGVMTYGGVMANNGAGVNGLNKLGFGGLTVSATQAYTGRPIWRMETLRWTSPRAFRP